MIGIIKKLDPTGIKIISILQNKARIPFSQIGKQVGLTGPAVAERVKRLESSGIISGYQTDIDLDAAGFPIRAFIRMHTTPERYARLLKTLEEIPEILEADHVTGEDAFYLRVAVENTQKLEHIIAQLSPFGETATAIILSTPIKRHIALPKVDPVINSAAR